MMANIVATRSNVVLAEELERRFGKGGEPGEPEEARQ
jgi:hypothetical protein